MRSKLSSQMLPHGLLFLKVIILVMQGLNSLGRLLFVKMVSTHAVLQFPCPPTCHFSNQAHGFLISVIEAIEVDKLVKAVTSMPRVQGTTTESQSQSLTSTHQLIIVEGTMLLNMRYSIAVNYNYSQLIGGWPIPRIDFVIGTSLGVSRIQRWLE